MGEERRTSRRSEFRLPFQWRLLTEGDSLATQIRRWSLEDVLQRQQRTAFLETDFEQAARAIPDSATSTALRALQTRLELLESATAALTPTPSKSYLELSTDGVGFWSKQPLTEGDQLVVHIVLPGGYQLVASACVSHSQPQPDKDGTPAYRIGARLSQLDPVSGRRLTRLIIS